MTKEKNKKPPQVRYQCMFCNSPGVTKQHVWPQWFREYLGVDPNKGYTHVSGKKLYGAGYNGIDKPTIEKYNKDLSLRHVRRVCKKCNSEWLSVLEKSTIPYLSKMILGEPVAVDVNNQRLIATWAVMASIVNDYDNENSQLISDAERNDFFIKKVPSYKWKVWAAKIREDTDQIRCYDEHYNIKRINGNIGISNQPTIFTFFRIKNCLLLTSYTEVPNAYFSFDGFLHDNMIEIYPDNFESIDLSRDVGLNDFQINIMVPFLSLQHPFLAT